MYLVVVLILEARRASNVMYPPKGANDRRVRSNYRLPARYLPVIACVATPRNDYVSLSAQGSTPYRCRNTFIHSFPTVPFVCNFTCRREVSVARGLAKGDVVRSLASYRVVVFQFHDVLPPNVSTM